MCGICGEIKFKRGNVETSNIVRMADALVHRGPDDHGIYCEGAVGLGHRRLSIIDLSANGRQPIWNSDRSMCIVLNGEIYNYRELKQELLSRGYRFCSTTDTEVAVNAIHCWGIEAALSKFLGMFSFAVWDKNNKVLYLCRDRAGIKPLYYCMTDETLLFASEMKAIMAHGSFRKEIDRTALAQYFINGYFLGGNTVFKNVFKLSPGHYMSMDSKGSYKTVKYWGLDKIEKGSFNGSFEKAAGQLEDLLEDAFKLRLVSDVPVGLFLSGGVDSSLVSSILKKKGGADVLNITIGFNEKGFDESEMASKVSRELGVRQVVHYIDKDEARNSLFKFCEIYDEPFADTSGIPTYILSKLAREHVKVALSADGGDEQFCGYEGYTSYLKRYRILSRFPLALRAFASGALKNFMPYRQLISCASAGTDSAVSRHQPIAQYEKMLKLLKVSSKEGLIQLMYEKGWAYEKINDILDIDKKDIFKGTVLETQYLAAYKDGILDAMMRTDYTAFLRDDILVKVDRASMHVSLECRDPFLDHRIAEFAYSLPDDYLFAGGEHKRITRHILRKWVSDAVVSSPKRGFMIPLYQWLRTDWKSVILEYLSAENIKKTGILNEDSVRREVGRFYKYNGCRAEKIWMLLNFQMWAQRWYM